MFLFSIFEEDRFGIPVVERSSLIAVAGTRRWPVLRWMIALSSWWFWIAKVSLPVCRWPAWRDARAWPDRTRCSRLVVEECFSSVWLVWQVKIISKAKSFDTVTYSFRSQWCSFEYPVGSNVDPSYKRAHSRTWSREIELKTRVRPFAKVAGFRFFWAFRF